MWAHFAIPASYRFGRGEGVVVIVLKPLAAALRDHDRIYATVRRFSGGEVARCADAH